MKAIQFMNEVPDAAPSALARRMNDIEDLSVEIISFYDYIDGKVEEEIDVHTLNATGHLDVTAYYRLRKILSEKSPDIFHTHPNATGAVARLVAALTDTGIVDTRHNDHSHFSTIQRVLNLPAAAVTDYFVSNSRSTQRSFLSLERTLLHLNRGRDTVIYNGIDPTYIEIVPDEPPVSCDGPTIVCAARYVQQKNHEAMVHAMKIVRREFKDATLVMIGDGERYDEINQLIESKGLTDAIIQTGYIDNREDVLAQIKYSDVFVIPSWYEGFGVAAVEAMLLGTPVVASDINVLKEVVNGAGVFAPPDDYSTLAQRLVEMLRNDQKRLRLGAVGAERVKDNFTISRAARKYAKIYEEIC